jgi:hypothetical protein
LHPSLTAIVHRPVQLAAWLYHITKGGLATM